MGLNEGWEPGEWDWYENVGYKALAWETTEEMEGSWKRDHENGNSSGKSPTIDQLYSYTVEPLLYDHPPNHIDVVV